MMAFGQCLHLRLDAEQARQKILEMRRQRDQQLRLCLAGKSCSRQPGCFELRAQRSIAISQKIEERGIETDKPVPVIKIVERKSKAQAQVLVMRRVISSIRHCSYVPRVSRELSRIILRLPFINPDNPLGHEPTVGASLLANTSPASWLLRYGKPLIDNPLS